MTLLGQFRDAGLGRKGSKSLLAVGAALLTLCGTAAAQQGARPSETRRSVGSLPGLNAKTDYGAKGDNGNDDGPALARALAACNGGHPLYLPPGVYRTRQQLRQPAHCKLYGDQNFTYLLPDSPNVEIFADNATGAFTSGGAVLTMDEASQLAGVGVHADNIAGHADAIDIAGNDVVLSGILAVGGGTYSVSCPGRYQIVSISHSLIGYSQGTGLNMQCADSTLSFNIIFANAASGVFGFGAHTRAIGNKIETNGQYGLRYYNTYDGVITGNDFTDNGYEGLYINGYKATTTDLSVTGNSFSVNGSGQPRGSGNDCHLRLDGPVSNVEFAGNHYDTGIYGKNPTSPNYVWCASSSSSPRFDAGSRVLDAYNRQVIGIYENGAIQAAVTAARAHISVVSTAELEKTGDIALAAVPGMSVYFYAGRTYECSGHISGTAGAAGGARIALAGAEGLTAESSSVTAQNWNGRTLNAQSTTISLGQAVGAATAAFTDIYFNAAVSTKTAGKLEVEFAQNVSARTPSKTYRNSTMRCSRLD